MDNNNELELVYEAQLETEKSVLELKTRGKTPSEIQRETGVPPAAQRQIYDRFMAYATTDAQMHKRAKEIVKELDMHYEYIIRELESTLQEIDEAVEPDLRLKKDVLKELANVNKMRAEQLQKAGVLNSEAIGAEVAAMQQEHDQVLALLKRVAREAKGPQFKALREIIAQGLAEIRGEVIDVGQ